MIPNEVQKHLKDVLPLARGLMEEAEFAGLISNMRRHEAQARIDIVREWLDKPYSHRNGETEPPEVQGHYWFRGLNTRSGHRIRKWVLGEISKNMQFFYAHGWGSPEEFIGEWHGPIPEPEVHHDA